MLDELMASAREILTVSRVYGEPYEKGGVTMIPAAAVSGGGGGGAQDGDGPQGQGGGFGMKLKPAGVYVVTDDAVRWQPALDVNRLVASVTAVALVAILAGTRLERRRTSRRRR